MVALILDGKTFAEDGMVIALGVTVTGEKVILGFVQTATENETVCAAFLRELVERGLCGTRTGSCVSSTGRRASPEGDPDGLRYPGGRPAVSVA